MFGNFDVVSIECKSDIVFKSCTKFKKYYSNILKRMNVITEKKQEHLGANNDNLFGWLVPTGTKIYFEKEM